MFLHTRLTPAAALLAAFFLLTAPGALAQTPTPPATIPGQASTSGYRIISPISQPTVTPGMLELLELEGRFADAVATGGGKAFAEWFAEDAVVLNNGKAAVRGRGAIAASANWDPRQYHLSWTAQGADMGPSSDMGYTWGHYDGEATTPDGQKITTSGRFITVWKKTKLGWKVAMDASSEEPPNAGDCCALSKP